MSGLLRAVAALPQSHGGLSVGRSATRGRAWPAPICGPRVAVATAASAARFGEVAGDQAKGYARPLSSTPAMLDLLATALLRWRDQVETDTEINGDDAVEWLSGFITEVRGVLQAMVSPLALERLP